MPETIIAEETLDLAGAARLLDTLKSHRGMAVTLDLGSVRQAGAPALQVLLAARSAWDADGVAFTLAPVSGPCREAVRLMGAEAELLGEGGAA
ncbi:STAS domain-containing protein [Tranquillimonas alkanivorans]|uniref:Chemotaxis protein CheX n=1 Tax=Tranquillimonas alkanivorans TaxID=441119 RepID=A0A1I5SAQ0_9RHOB|nr:STAS domain-containing protein [Tranquillimonas alkanivorans]SFP67637.1 chemotaxis protein CheX [Tranquillimonas alkanivorans]